MMQYHAMSMMFHNSNHVRYPPHRAPPKLPQFLLPRSEVTLNPPFGIVPKNEVTINLPFNIIHTQTVQQSILSQLSVIPNSRSSNPINQVSARRKRYDPISDLLPPVEVDFSVVKTVVEQVLSGCPNRTLAIQLLSSNLDLVI
jgi:hypothetical protein